MRADVPGSTQSLPLRPLTHDRASGAVLGLTPRTVRTFSLLGVVWDDPSADLRGRVQVRTREAGTGEWTDWQDLETHYTQDGADPDSSEAASGKARGATAPLWVGESDGVEVRVLPTAGEPDDADPVDTGSGEGVSGDAGEVSTLPAGMRLDLVDPGEAEAGESAGGAEPVERGEGAEPAEGAEPVGGAEPAEGAEPPEGAEPAEPAEPAGPAEGAEPAEPAGPAEGAEPAEPAEGAEEPRTGVMTAAAKAASAANSALVPLGATRIPSLTAEETREELVTLRGTELTEQQQAKPYIGPRPAIVTRRGWGADESLREKSFVYTSTVKAAFVHHTASGNNYSCSQVPSLIRGFYRYHTRSLGWRDIGYNFLVDKCGRIYEGRAGGVAKPVKGAHTMGFNSKTTGIAVIGSYGSKKPSSKAVKAVARLTAWKLGLHGMNPKKKTSLTSGGGNLYAKGKKVKMKVISGHRDGFNTSCPGGKLYKKLSTVRSKAAKYQGR
ncbi:peptidoglycan recognition protein [Streptomyces sp. MD20-1-1]|uniref:peptidoglycan recognition protein family protein n=1 Tax=Streptomyces sp. MD20-1-1 TaxID=3028668 RepID=UPI0029B0F1EF|nr:peptidoglycan recognition protein [Streptomyces sp. MD20-1-1]WSB84852.1 peptidoglycan recognition protein [Streptomyces cellulosae]